MANNTNNQTHRTISHDTSDIKIEGATPQDLCPNLDYCENEQCKLYHPVWAIGYCVNYFLNKCKKKNNCAKHVSWAEMKKHVKAKDHYDYFSKKPF